MSRLPLRFQAEDHPKPIPWTELTTTQKIMCAVEGEMHCLVKVHGMNMDWVQAKRASGYTEDVYTLEETKQMTQQMVTEEKLASKRQSSGKGAKQWGKKWDKTERKWEKKDKRGDSEKPPWLKAKQGDHDHDQSTLSADAIKSLSRRTQQLEAALNKGGHVKQGGPGGPEKS